MPRRPPAPQDHAKPRSHGRFNPFGALALALHAGRRAARGCSVLVVLAMLSSACGHSSAAQPAGVAPSPPPVEVPSATQAPPAEAAHAAVPRAVAPTSTASPPAVSPGSIPVQVLVAAPLQSPEDLDRPLDGDMSYEVQVRGAASAKTVSSCRGLIELPLSSDLEIEPEDELSIQLFWSTAADCLALSILQSAQPARESMLGEVLSSKDPTRLLPPELGLTDFADARANVREASAHCRSWKAYDPSLRLTKRSANTLSVRADIWSGEVLFYARADFDGDGYEDLLVRRNGHADGGSYAAPALFILSRTPRDSCLRVSREAGRS